MPQINLELIFSQAFFMGIATGAILFQSHTIISSEKAKEFIYKVPAQVQNVADFTKIDALIMEIENELQPKVPAGQQHMMTWNQLPATWGANVATAAPVSYPQSSWGGQP